MTTERPLIEVGGTSASRAIVERMTTLASEHPELAVKVVEAVVSSLELRPEQGVDWELRSWDDEQLHPWLPGAAIKPVMRALDELSRVGQPTIEQALEQSDTDERDAKVFLASYKGTFDFLLDLRGRLEADPWYELSERQVAAVLRCRDRELSPSQTRPARGSGVDLSPLPSGRRYYAVDNASGGITFFEIARIADDDPDERWRGWTFVDQVIGGGGSQKLGRQRPGETYDGQWPSLLAAVVADPHAAMERFGRELGRCGVCGKTLTDETSRAFGIGPVCREGWGA